MKSKLIYQIYIYKQIKIIPNYHIKNKYIYIYIGKKTRLQAGQ
jgi:hypothetical protein